MRPRLQLETRTSSSIGWRPSSVRRALYLLWLHCLPRSLSNRRRRAVPPSRTPSRTPSFTNLPEIPTPYLSPSPSSSNLVDSNDSPSSTPATTPASSPSKTARLRAWLSSPSHSLASSQPSSPPSSSESSDQFTISSGTEAEEWELVAETDEAGGAVGAEHWGCDHCGYPVSEGGMRGLVKPHPEVRARRRYKTATSASAASRPRKGEARGREGGS